VVTVINPAVEVSTRTFQVEIQVVNDKPGLKPGSFAKAVIAVSEDPHAQTVPLAAMVRYAGVIKLFLFENGTAREVQFTPGVQNSEWVEVARPELPENSQVITSGQYALAEGTAVRIRPQRKPEDSPATAQTAP
jgi:multidrug efflux pump subunit AcrA (membrane-fusion protein)